MLSSFGGLLGILLALAASRWASHVCSRSPLCFNGGIVALAFLFSAAVGVIFGFLPGPPGGATRSHRGPAARMILCGVLRWVHSCADHFSLNGGASYASTLRSLGRSEPGGPASGSGESGSPIASHAARSPRLGRIRLLQSGAEFDLTDRGSYTGLLLHQPRRQTDHQPAASQQEVL